jgi:SAM-dependent methyltransferase
VTESWLKDTSSIYTNYGVYSQGAGAEQVTFNTQTGTNIARSERIINWLKNTYQMPSKGKVLDIGCGNGAFLKSFKNAYPEWLMMGMELDDRNKASVESIAGVSCLYTGSLEDLDTKFDLIVLIHALEHVNHPISFLHQVARKLNPEGYLLIQVPDLSTSPFDLLIADHCSHFSADTLKHFIHSAGYEVDTLEIGHVPRELTALSRPIKTEKRFKEPASWLASKDWIRARNHLNWLATLLRESQGTTIPSGIFGSSISGTWLASTLGDKVSFFVDEDPNRAGRNHLGRPILSPSDAPTDKDIIIPMSRHVAQVISRRLAHEGLKLFIPSLDTNTEY